MPAAIGGAADGDAATTAAVAAAEGLLKQSEVAPLPIDALTEAIAYMLSCARAEAMALAAHREVANPDTASAAATATAAAVDSAETEEAARAAEAAVALGAFVAEGLSGGSGRGVSQLLSLLLGCLQTAGAKHSSRLLS